MHFLRAQRISKTYISSNQGIKHALNSINLEIYKGEVLGLLGVNGAGKTTLSSLLATLHPPTSGEILWNGQSIYDNLLEFRKIIGYCPQYPNLEKNLSLEENLVFSGRCYGLSKNQAISSTKTLLKKLKLESYRKANAEQLSGGYRQRFLIARALIHNPQFVILDEPTVGLDSHIRRELWEIISQLRADSITVLLTTHYLDEAEKLSDRVCLIHNGTIRTIDTPNNLKLHHKKNSLEEIFLTFVDDPDAAIFKSMDELDA